MPDLNTTTATPTGIDSPVSLLTGERFFVRRISLVPGTAVQTQVELALEVQAPFTLEQLFHGYLVDETKSHALVFAAYRRGFSAGEQSAWEQAQAVLPDFLFWTDPTRRPRGKSALLQETESSLTAVVWDEASALPSLVLTRGSTPETVETVRDQLAAEVTRRSGIARDRIEPLRGKIAVVSLSKDGLILTAEHGPTVTLGPATLALADIRDKALLATRRREERHTTLLWRLFSTAMIGLAACLLIEGGLLATRALLAGKQSQLAERAPAVQQIESAQLLAAKLEKMTAQQLRPFEMLAAINSSRPSSVEFLRVTTNGPQRLDIEAQTSEAGDLRNYENALRSTAGIQRVELRDPRMRAGRTSFQLEVTFKADWYNAGGGK
ncbi:MAG: hypothetical protein K9N01_16400 [Cephaloticoccus sp.]|nr:hypothetical protein [Cephaloticoccus sp.]